MDGDGNEQRLSFADWSQQLGGNVITVAVAALNGAAPQPTDEELAAIVRDACETYVARGVRIEFD